MTDRNNNTFTELELDALKETMNIAFGSAAADLAELLDIFINLHVPNMNILNTRDLIPLVKDSVNDLEGCRIVEQGYHSDFRGISFLVFPYGMEKELLSYFSETSDLQYDSDRLMELEKEALLEIGNILNAACIGNLFKMLNTSITYLRPVAYKGGNILKSLRYSKLKDKEENIVLSAEFSFEDREARGTLFLINSRESIPYFKNVLHRFTG